MLAAIVATWWLATGTAAQSAIPAWVYVKDSQGQLWFVGRNAEARAMIPLYPATDEQLAAIPSTGQYLVPKPDGTGLEGGGRPDWDAGAIVAPAPVAAPAPTATPTGPPPQEPIKLGGERGENTAPFQLAAGTYVAMYKTELRSGATSCFTSATLYRVEGKRRVETVYSTVLNRRDGQTRAAGETRIYGVTAGAHYLEAEETGCSWSVEIRPQ